MSESGPKRPIYLDHQGTTPCDPEVIAAMLPFFGERSGNANARSHAQGRAAARALAAATEQIAALVGATPESMVLTSGASAANHLALTGLVPVDGRDELCISALEHDSVVDAAQASGLRVRVIPSTRGGIITADALASVLSSRTALVSVIAASHELGTIQPIAALAEQAHAAGALFHTDATQVAGKIPMSIAGIDLLTYSAHKLYGPQGIGALWVRASPPLALRIPHRGTPPLALAVGFGAACALALQRFELDCEHLTQLSATFLEALGEHTLNGDRHPRLPGSLSLCLRGVDAEALLLELADELCLSTGAACASAKREPSRVLRAIGLSDVEIASSVRVSFGRHNTHEEARHAGALLRSRL